MPVSFTNLEAGKEYTRTKLADLWGDKSCQALAKKIVTPAETPYIILFITEEEQSNLTQHQASIDNNSLNIKGEFDHRSDQRLTCAEQNGDQIHLFYQKNIDMPFIYYGRVYMIDYELKPAEPSWFSFLFYKKNDITKQFEQSFSRRQASYKMVTVLSLLDTASSDAASDIDVVARKFMEFYETRAKLGAMVEKDKITMARVQELSFSKVKQVMINNPVFYLSDILDYDKPANLLSFKNHIANNLDQEMFQSIRRIALRNLYDYYDEIGGLCAKGLGYWGQPESCDAQGSIYELAFQADHEKERLSGELVAEKMYSSEGAHQIRYVERLQPPYLLEECSNLDECEKILEDLAGRVKYFGQIELSKEDIDHLGVLFRIQVENNLPAWIRSVAEKTPAALAAFLVGQGIYYYHEGDYWTSISNSLAIDDINWQVKIGQEYLKTLVSFGKPVLEVSEFHAYVANILLHGGIPQSLLPEFFETVIKLLVHKDLIEPEEIKGIVNEWRSEDKEYSSAEGKLLQLNKKKEEYLQKKEQAEDIFQVCEELEQLKDEVGDKGYLINALDDNHEESWHKYNDELNELNNKIVVLQEEERENNKWLGVFYLYDEPVLRSADSIQSCIDQYVMERAHIDSIPDLEKGYMACRKELAELLRKFNENISLESYESYLAELSWEELISSFREAAELQDLQKQKEKTLNEAVVAPEKPGGLVWSGLVLLFAGLALLAFNPNELLFWLSAFAGAVIIVPGLTGYRIRKNASERKYQEKQRLEQELESLRVKERKVLDQAYESAGRFLPDEASADVDAYKKTAGLLEEIRVKYEKYIDAKHRLQVAREKADELKINLTGFTDLLELESIEDKSLEELYQLAEDRLNEACSKRKQAEEMENEFKRINGEVLGLYAKGKVVQEKINTIEVNLMKLGEGDLERGRVLYSQYKEKLNRINALEQTICNEEAKFSDELVAFDLKELGALLKNLKQYIEETDSDIASLQKRMEALTRPLDYIDEPIRRFIIHGDEWADGWLIESVRIYMQTMAGEGFKQSEKSSLPVRVVEAFHDWREKQSKEVGKQQMTEVNIHQKLNTPGIKRSPTGEIYLHFPSQRFYSPEASYRAWIRICDSEGEQLLEDIPLDVYQREGVLLETENTSITFLEAVGGISVVFGFGASVLQTWFLRLFIEDGLPVIIFDESGNLVFSDSLPRAKLWFVFEESIEFMEIMTPLEEDKVELGETYYHQLINTTKFSGDKIRVVDANNIQYDLNLTGKEAKVPRLSGEVIDGVVIDEVYPLYYRESIAIYVPTVDLEDLKGWLIEVGPLSGYPGNKASWNFEELEDFLKVQPCGSMVSLTLASTHLFEEMPCGRYKIRIINPDGDKFNYDISFVESFELTFKPQIIPPYNKDMQPVSMELICPDGLAFDLLEPAEVIESGGKISRFRVESAGNSVRGSIRRIEVEDSTFKLPVSITVPKIRWAVEGLRGSAFEVWSEKVGEFWYGDWQEARSLKLKISVPDYIDARASLKLDGTAQYNDSDIKNGLARFDLLSFLDTLKTETAPGKFELTLYDRNRKEVIIDCLLFVVIVRWAVESFTLEHNREGQSMQYQFRWVDRGKMSNRVLKLWNKSRPFDPPLVEKEIPDETNELVFKASLKELPPGQYLAQFLAEDPWEGTRTDVSFPQHDYNIFPFEITGDQIVITSWDVQWVKQNEIYVCGRLVNAPGSVTVNVTIIGRKNEQWTSWSSSAITDDGGYFNVIFKAEKDFAHWIGISVDNEPLVNLYAVIPEAAPLYFLLGEEVPEVIRGDSSGIAAVQIFDKKDLDHQYPFYVLGNEALKKSLEEKKEEIDLRVKMADESIKEAKLLAHYSRSDYTLKLEQGVRCTGKGCMELGYTRIFPSQSAWFNHTQRLESPECKSMETNYVNIEVKVVFVWDADPFWQRAINVFPSLERPVFMSSMFEKHLKDKLDNYENIDELANALIEQEKIWFEQLIKAGLIDSCLEG